VRLRQGDYQQETVFGADPAAMARRWIDDGATFLHLVDLDGAKLAQFLDAGVAGRGDQTRDQRRLGDLPGQGVFAAARSDEKNVHETGQ